MSIGGGSTEPRGAGMPDEFELIARYFAPLARDFPGAYGLRDDAAVIRPSPGCELVVKTDTIVSGIDFLPHTPAGLVGRKALRVNLSDLAAKGATARAYLLALTLPHSIEEQWIAAFAEGLRRDQAEYGVHLIGGDTGSTTGPAVVTVCAFGDVPLGRIVRRGGARPGDLVFVTGTIGDAVLGLAAARGELEGLDADCRSFLVGRYQTPQPRVQVGPGLAGLATASVDISDGLVADLNHICTCSGVAALVAAPSIPVSAAARSVLNAEPRQILAMLTGGDDYEILFTAPAGAVTAIEELSRSSGVPITAIWHVSASEGPSAVTVLDASEHPLSLPAGGWTHFG